MTRPHVFHDMNLNIAGLHPEAIGVLPGIFGKIHGITMQRKYGV